MQKYQVQSNTFTLVGHLSVLISSTDTNRWIDCILLTDGLIVWPLLIRHEIPRLSNHRSLLHKWKWIIWSCVTRTVWQTADGGSVSKGEGGLGPYRQIRRVLTWTGLPAVGIYSHSAIKLCRTIFASSNKCGYIFGGLPPPIPPLAWMPSAISSAEVEEVTVLCFVEMRLRRLYHHMDTVDGGWWRAGGWLKRKSSHIRCR